MSYQNPRVAYLSMEFGLDASLPIYAGGLGVLAGDFLRAAKALERPVVGVGIAWSEGYTTQRIDAAGQPEDHPTPLDRTHLVRERPVVTVPIAGRDVPLTIYRVTAFDNAPLYLLEPALERDRWITRRLYGGGKADRIAQELILGVGAVRALEALSIQVDLYHFNEGHALFAGLELYRRARRAGAAAREAREEVRAQVVFTTHTPVDAGNEEHDLDLLHHYATGLELTRTELERLGGDPFNMTVGALRLAGRANAVAELHGQTAQRMWCKIDDAAPIIAITNGVCHRRWQDPDLRAADSDAALFATHQRAKTLLLDEIERRTHTRLSPDRLLIGFARRATAYKRATLLFHDPARIGRLLDDGAVQLVYAGKAHPKDEGGIELITELVALARQHPGRVVFLPNYDLELGRLLTRGCDVWLNTPRRPLEACGTSGMKAALNGVLNLSILDGWWPEGCEHGVNGWRAGHWEGAPDELTDLADASSLYEILEGDVTPIYQDRARWVRMMRASMAMAERFTADRMVRDYYERLYDVSPLVRARRPAARGT
jgi:starch phosphorylase